MSPETPLLAVTGASLTLTDFVSVAREQRPVNLDKQARARMLRSYAWVKAAGQREDAIYGVNTGFGSLARVRIKAEDRATLSLNLVRSHAAGVGKPLGEDVVRGMMLLRANALAKGASGCRPRLVETLLSMLNAGITPVVPSQGSCGSSGDLAPLAHLALALVEGDHGRVRYQGVVQPAADAMAKANIPRLTLEAKDGLALTNGAQLTTSLAALACVDAQRVLLAAEVAAAMSIEALKGASRAFHPAVNELRPYPGAKATAANLRTLLAGSSLMDSLPGKVQDAYSLRCSPQVIGSSRDAMTFAMQQVSVEINAATDNPLILLDADTGADEGVLGHDNKAFSAGLFHGEPVGVAMDVLKIAVAEVGSLSERRLYRLTTGNLSQRLPPALARRDRPELGMLVPHTSAAALVSENKLLCHPSSVDSIPTCEDQEDHVAMSTTAARHATRVVRNARAIVAIELLGAHQALRFRQAEDPGVRLGRGTGAAWAVIDEALSGLGEDVIPSESIRCLEALIFDGGLDAVCARLYPVGSAP